MSKVLLVSEFTLFLRENKKVWMPPIILTFALLGALLVFTHVYEPMVIVLPRKGERHYEKPMPAEQQRPVQQFRRLAKRTPQFR